MKRKEDPATLFEQQQSIKNCFCVEIDDDEKMAVMMMVTGTSRVSNNFGG